MRIFGITIKKTDTSIYILSNKPIQKGDFILTISGYPHWTNFPQQCTMTGFDNGDIGLRESVRVSGKCFRKIIWEFRLINHVSEALSNLAFKNQAELIHNYTIQFNELKNSNKILSEKLERNPTVVISQFMSENIIHMLPDPNKVGTGRISETDFMNMSFSEEINGQKRNTHLRFVKVLKGESDKVINGVVIQVLDYNIKVFIPLVHDKLKYNIMGVDSEVDTYFWDFYKAGIRMLTQEPWNMITTFVIAQNNVLSTHIEEW